MLKKGKKCTVQRITGSGLVSLVTKSSLILHQALYNNSYGGTWRRGQPRRHCGVVLRNYGSDKGMKS